MNHCVMCGARVSTGYTGAHHVGTNTIRCLPCQTAHTLRSWSYPASTQGQKELREKKAGAK